MGSWWKGRWRLEFFAACAEVEFRLEAENDVFPDVAVIGRQKYLEADKTRRSFSPACKSPFGHSRASFTMVCAKA